MREQVRPIEIEPALGLDERPAPFLVDGDEMRVQELSGLGLGAAASPSAVASGTPAISRQRSSKGAECSSESAPGAAPFADAGRAVFDGAAPAQGYVEVPSLGSSVYFDFHPGLGPAYVLVHGLAVDMESWNEAADRLVRRGSPVLRIDLLGHGKTLDRALERGGREYGIVEDNALALKTVIEHLGLKNLVLAGHSYGGGVILSLLSLPLDATVDAVVPIAPYTERLDPYYRKLIPWWLPIGFWTRWMEMFFPTVVDASARMVGAWMGLQIFPRLIRGENRRLGRSLPERVIERRAKAAVSTMLASIDFKAERLIADIPQRLPVTLVTTPDDWRMPSEPVERFAAAMSAAGKRIETIAIAGADHFLIFKLPERIVEILMRTVR